MMKICSWCKIEKSSTDFYADKSNKDGLYYLCKTCQSAKMKKIRKENPEKTKIKYKEHNQSIAGKYREYKFNAKDRGIVFDLTKDDFESFWQKPCHYCDSPIETIGIDRKDNSIGYTLDNCLSCCITCNSSKSKRTYEEFIEHCKKVARKWAQDI
jgi:hypothetical protein